MAAPPAKRSKILADLRGISGCTRTALAEILSRLHAEGDLPSGIGGHALRTLRHHFARSVEDELGCPTPYGNLVQNFSSSELGRKELPFLHPAALMHHLSKLSAPFYELLASLGHPEQGLRIILYIDEVRPGNPLRPSKGRTTQCIYWTFVDLPAHLLVQTRFWFLFAAVRSSVVSEIPGGVSGIMKLVLHKFFPADGSGLQRGILLVNRDRQHLLRACFGGFMADEKGLKEVFSYKGASGSKPCMTCSNVVRISDKTALEGSSLVDLSCSDRSLFRRHTKQTVLGIVERLRAGKETMTRTQYSKLEQAFGVTFEPRGVLADHHCQLLVDPVAHYYRDWMHTVASGGVLSTEMAMFVNRLVELGYQHTMLCRWAMKFHLPKARGKVDPEWFSSSRVGNDHCATFASEQLSMLPLLLSFAEEVVKTEVPDHRRCLRLLAVIVQILSLGPSESLEHLDVLQSSVVEHHALFARLYPGVIKPKLHHLLHVPEDMRRLGKLLSCFPTERKHRDTKQAALHIFRNFEGTLMQDLALQQVKSIVEGASFEPAFLIDALTAGDERLLRATSCRLPCGEVRVGDIVHLRRGGAAMIDMCWQRDSEIVIQTRALPPVGRHSFRAMPGGLASFIAPSDVKSAAIWAQDGPDLVRVLAPLV